MVGSEVHRWTGRLALLVSLPVAYHCIFLLGFQSGDDRVSPTGRPGPSTERVRQGAGGAPAPLPVWVLPTAGGLLFAVLIAVWYTSAVWFLRLAGVGL